MTSAQPHVRAVGFLLSQLGFETTARFKELMAEVELEPRHVAVLRAIGWSDGPAQHAVSEALQIPASSMVALVDQLEGRGLVERRPHPSDRRTRTLHLTPAGHRRLERAVELTGGLEAVLTAGLGEDERHQLVELLSRVSTNLGLMPGVHPAASTD